MDYVYSAKNNAFFPVVMLDSYKDAGWDLSDVIPVDESVFIEFSAYVPRKIRVSGGGGLPMWADAPEDSADAPDVDHVDPVEPDDSSGV